MATRRSFLKGLLGGTAAAGLAASGSAATKLLESHPKVEEGLKVEEQAELRTLEPNHERLTYNQRRGFRCSDSMTSEAEVRWWRDHYAEIDALSPNEARKFWAMVEHIDPDARPREVGGFF